jgi:hypothetical protein
MRSKRRRVVSVTLEYQSLPGRGSLAFSERTFILRQPECSLAFQPGTFWRESDLRCSVCARILDAEILRVIFRALLWRFSDYPDGLELAPGRSAMIAQPFMPLFVANQTALVKGW